MGEEAGTIPQAMGSMGPAKRLFSTRCSSTVAYASDLQQTPFWSGIGNEAVVSGSDLRG